ncbi:hypothetical protein [Lentibacillus cibarius]|uniref:Apea-like HEPN domain-containing protein n=1 Tax=Lentibacillus cibarius TaxID=2583219 RepID=A0A5S3QIZ2_9BACI|nr:hypothetical protein [Lentibacillus cibarius]TMN21900.1 hypothetical protein FFL34_07065 [Lentibacillus cibarius]
MTVNKLDIYTMISKLMEDYDQFESLYITFKIPFSLKWIGPVDVKVNNVDVKINLNNHFKSEEEQRKTSGEYIIAGNAELIRERHGLLSYTELSVTFNTFNSDYDYVELSIASINKLLDVYKIYNPEEYHIQNIKKDDLLDGIQYSCLFQNRRPISGFLSFRGITSRTERIQVPKKASDYLSSNKSYSYWKLALANAKSRFYLEDYPMTIVEANIALESFIYEHIYERLKTRWRKKDIDNFLCKFNGKRHPSIHRVIKKMYIEVPLPNMKSYKMLDKQINKITEYRNHIVHGNRPPLISKEYAKEALDTLEHLIEESISSCVY